MRSTIISLGLNDPPAGEREAFISGLATLVEVRPSVNADFIRIRVIADNPEFATDVTNGVMKAYLDQRIELRRRPGLEEFYAAQIEQTRERLNALESRVRDQKERTGVVTVDEQLRLKLQELSGLEGELNALRGEVEELEHKATTLRAQIAQQPTELTTLRTVTRNPTIFDLEQKRLDLETERALELNRFNENSPPIQELDPQHSSHRRGHCRRRSDHREHGVGGPERHS